MPIETNIKVPYSTEENLIAKEKFDMQMPHVCFNPSSEGVIFQTTKGAGIDAQREMQCLLQTIIDGMEILWNGGLDTKEEIPKVRFSEFSFAFETASEDLNVFFCERGEPMWPSVTDAAWTSFSILFNAKKKSEVRFPGLIRAVVPFSTCCRANMTDIRETLKTFIADSVETIRRRVTAMQISHLMGPYDVSVEIHSNSTLKVSDEVIVRILHDELTKFNDIMVFDGKFENTLAVPEKFEAMTALFQVIILEDQAYFSVVYRPHAVHWLNFFANAACKVEEDL